MAISIGGAQRVFKCGGIISFTTFPENSQFGNGVDGMVLSQEDVLKVDYSVLARN
jgi:hypothetical protein